VGAMTKATLIVALLLTASPVAAQVSTFDGQSQLSALGGQFVPSEAPTSAPTTGVICIEGIAGPARSATCPLARTLAGTDRGPGLDREVAPAREASRLSLPAGPNRRPMNSATD
jgi:hypothetical protein